ncbi:hypothetical protein ACFLUW_01140 [Chloroflexota bacterium]
MAFTKDEQKLILAALEKKVPKPENCPICGNENWNVGDSMVALVVQGNAKKLNITGPIMPCIPVTCANCGNTHLLNLIGLGLRDLVEEKKREKIAEEKVE